MADHISDSMRPWECAENCPCHDNDTGYPSDTDSKPLSLGHEPINIPAKVPLRLWLEAALIAVILAWSAINGFWILTHAW